MKTKKCCKCKDVKSVIEFYKWTHGKDGYSTYCRICTREFRKTPKAKAAYKLRYDKDKEKFKLKSKTWYNNNKARHRATDIEWRSRNKDHSKKSNWKKNNIQITLGIRFTIDDYNKKLIECNHKCEICESDGSGFTQGLIVDHDHKTSLFRGILCNNCNLMLGHTKDSISVLENTIKYLKRSRNEL